MFLGRRIIGGILGGFVGIILGLMVGMDLGGNYFTSFEFNGVRGYEATGQLGAIIGGLIGAIIGVSLLVIHTRWKHRN